MSKIYTRCKGLLFIGIIMIFGGIYSLSALEPQVVEGYLICIEPDGKGAIKIESEFSECSGSIAIVNSENKIYTITGSKSNIAKLHEAHKRRMGVLMDQNITGKVHGHERARHFVVGSEEYVKNSNPEKIKGTIYCLLPDYKKTYLKYVVSNKPCYNYTPHAHVLYTADGQIIAINGTEELVKTLESSTQRKGVFLMGSISGNEKGRYIYLQ